MKVRFVLEVIADVDEKVSAAEAIAQFRGALFLHEGGKRSAGGVQIINVERVRLESAPTKKAV